MSNQKKLTLIKPAVRKRTCSMACAVPVAVIILVLFFAGYNTHHYVAGEPAAAAVSSTGVNAMKNLRTGNGEKAQVTFSDGTRVILNVSSTLRFPAQFEGNEREVHLEGEAFFDVSYNSDRPFVVHSQGTKVKVLGTSFNIRGWTEDSAVTVSVRGGSVSVQSVTSSDRSEVVLPEGYYTRVNPGSPPEFIQKIDVDKHLLWTAGGFHFSNTPFGQVLRDLERRFDIEIAVRDEHLLEVPFTGTFDHADPDEILSVLAAAMELRYHRRGMTVDFFIDDGEQIY